MIDAVSLGDEGKVKPEAYLRRLGYRILGQCALPSRRIGFDRGRRRHSGVCRSQTPAIGAYGGAIEAVDARKRAKLIQLASQYLAQHRLHDRALSLRRRIDPGRRRIGAAVQHIANAFDVAGMICDGGMPLVLKYCAGLCHPMRKGPTSCCVLTATVDTIHDSAFSRFKILRPPPRASDVTLEIEKGNFVLFDGAQRCGKVDSAQETVDRGGAPGRDRTPCRVEVSSKLRPSEIPSCVVGGHRLAGFPASTEKTVFENVSLPLLVRVHPRRKSGAKLQRRCGLSVWIHKKDLFPPGLSTGKQQRICIARDRQRPIMLLADEPTGNLDPS